MSTPTTYKTQGIIASVSIEPGNRLSITIDPVEPYDFPVKENGETKKYILFQSISNEKKCLAVKTTEPIHESTGNCSDSSKMTAPIHEAGKDSTTESDKPNGKVEAEVLFKIPGDSTFTLGNTFAFSDLLQLKENRTKVEIQIENYLEAEAKALSAVKDFPVSKIITK